MSGYRSRRRKRILRTGYLKIAGLNRRKTRKLTAFGVIFIMGLIMLILLIRLLYGALFAIRINIKDVEAMRIPPKEITSIYEICGKQQKDPQTALTTYLIYNRFFREKQTAKTIEQLQMDFFSNMDRIKNRIPEKQFNKYYSLIQTLTSEMKCFPIPVRSDYGEGAYIFGDSWSIKRQICGSGNHTGSDIFDRENIPGRLPIVSMAGGTVEGRGKNGRGGMFVGIRTEQGTYYLYDNLERLNDTIEVGTSVTPGTLLGYMGNGAGAAKGSIKGNPPTNVHIGIKVKSELTKNNFWINPYPFLRHLEDKTFAEYDLGVYSTPNL